MHSSNKPNRQFTEPPENPSVALLVTCIADLFRPSVAFASLQLLEQAGCEVTVPEQQTCCGQPAYNTGDYRSGRAIARQVIETFADYNFVVAPSGSCAGMMHQHYPALFEDDGEWRGRARDLASRSWEVTSFLTEVMQFKPDLSNASGKYTYHDSCAGLRELGIKEQPRQLLKASRGIDIQELNQTEVCCGFGGTFCAKMPDISEKMVDDKLDNALASGADTLLGGDLGCLLNLAGRAKRRNLDLDVRHVVEVIAGADQHPAIGERET